MKFESFSIEEHRGARRVGSEVATRDRERRSDGVFVGR